MEEFIDEKLSTDADYETLNRSLGALYQGRNELTALLELNPNETESKTVDVIKICFNSSSISPEDDVMSTVSPENLDCAHWVTNMTIKIENFSALYDSLYSSGLVRLENLMDGITAESQTQESCSRDKVAIDRIMLMCQCENGVDVAYGNPDGFGCPGTMGLWDLHSSDALSRVKM